MMMISFYVPPEHAEKVKLALFEAGAGKIGNYEHCSFEYSGVGQFKPLEGSQPFLGQTGKLEKVSELKVEIVFEDSILDQVIYVLKKHHPYETPAYFITKSVG